MAVGCLPEWAVSCSPWWMLREEGESAQKRCCITYNTHRETKADLHRKIEAFQHIYNITILSISALCQSDSAEAAVRHQAGLRQHDGRGEMGSAVVPVALTGRVDEVSEDRQRSNAVPLVTVLQFLQNKHQQPVREGVGWKTKRRRKKRVKTSPQISRSRASTSYACRLFCCCHFCCWKTPQSYTRLLKQNENASLLNFPMISLHLPTGVFDTLFSFFHWARNNEKKKNEDWKPSFHPAVRVTSLLQVSKQSHFSLTRTTSQHQTEALGYSQSTKSSLDSQTFHMA